MEITSLKYLAFTAITLIIYYIIPKKEHQWIVILVASLTFCTIVSKFAVLYMVATAFLVYIGSFIIQKYNDEFKSRKSNLEKEERKKLKIIIKKKQKIVLTSTIILALGVLIVLKYFNFFGETFNALSSFFSKNNSLFKTLHFLIPVGISYYTLMSISYVVDVYRGVIKAENNPFRVLLFVSYFPHIIEGPIDNYSLLERQFKKAHVFDYEKIINAICLLLLGYIKKMVIADRLAYISNEVFDHPNQYVGFTICIGIVAYAISIYFDFSGCIDIVRAISKMFDINISKNFNRPFFSKSIQEFWRRWHITLGLWLKNYIFYPVSLSKASKRIMAIASKRIKNTYYLTTVSSLLPLFCVWQVMGIWHGASWKYVVYGLYYFFIIAIGMLFEPLIIKFFEKTNINRGSKVSKVFKIFRTNVLVIIGLSLFRANDLSSFFALMKSVTKISISFANIHQLFDSINLYLFDYVLVVVLIAAFFVMEYKMEKGHSIIYNVINNPLKRYMYIIIAVCMIVLFGVYGTGYTSLPFVYAEF